MYLVNEHLVVSVAGRASWRLALLLFVLASCADVTQPRSFPAGLIAYDELGGGTILIAGADVTYVIDGSARTATFSPVETDWDVNYLALSPDGTHILHRLFELASLNGGASTYTTVVVNVNGREARALRGGYIALPSWSIDGNEVYYAIARATYRQSLVGDELPQLVQSMPEGISCGAWTHGSPASVSAAGQILFECRGEALYILTPPSSIQTVVEFEQPASIAFAWAQWSPDGTRIAYAARDRNDANPHIVVLDAASGAALARMESAALDGSAFCWHRAGDRLLVIRTSAAGTTDLFAVPIAGGMPVRIAAGLAMGGISCSR